MTSSGELAITASADFDSGIIALLPEGDTEITYPDGTSCPMHMTLAYVGDIEKIGLGDRDALRATCKYLASLLEPFELEKLSDATFGDVPVALYQSIELAMLRDTVMNHANAGHIVRGGETFPNWLPHITDGPDRVKIDRVALWLGDHRQEFPFKTPETADHREPRL